VISLGFVQGAHTSAQEASIGQETVILPDITTSNRLEFAFTCHDTPNLFCIQPKVSHLRFDTSGKADTRIEGIIAMIVIGPHSFPANGEINVVN